MSDFLLKITVYIIVFACAVPFLNESSVWVTFLIFFVSILIADALIKVVKRVWKSL
ncbi:hypothetical protein U8V72_19765 [Priestia filamentosa]|uniref:hypothetical protein n=1 Tax=Priestia filamentosa TaxID=1402861 RepID=UPI000A4F2E64